MRYEVQSKPVQPPGIFWRIMMSGVILVAGWYAKIAYQSIQGPLEGGMIAEQLDKDPVKNATARAVAILDIPNLIFFGSLIVIAVIWAFYFKNAVRYAKASKAPSDGE